jgi:hypothetical protein
MPQVRMAISGEPGSGKSQVVQAFLWHAYQHNWEHMIAVMAFIWKAALHLSTVGFPPHSTCHFFGVMVFNGHKPNPGHESKTAVQNRLRGCRFIFVDEFSFLSLVHLDGMIAACNQACIALNPTLQDEPNLTFGGRHTVFSGDPYQHEPPSGQPLHLYAALPREERHLKVLTLAGGERLRRGLCVWERLCDQVHLLTNQHRLDPNDEDGQKLFRFSRMFMRDNVTRAEIEEFCDALNSKAISSMHDIRHKLPHVLCLRNEVKNQLNRRMVVLHAAEHKQRVIMWENTTCFTGDFMRQQSAASRQFMQDALDGLPPEKTGKIARYGFFFEGMEYVFTDNRYTDLLQVNNNCAIARKIVLDPREPPDGLSKACRVLKYMPLALIVEPAGPALVRLYEDPRIPVNCIVVKPAPKVSAKVQLPVAQKDTNGSN